MMQDNNTSELRKSSTGQGRGKNAFREIPPELKLPPPIPSRTRRLFTSCGCGCLGLVIVLAIAMLWLYFWATKTYPVISGDVLITPQTQSITVIRVQPHDAGMKDLLRRLTRELPGRAAEETKPEIRQLMERFGKKDLAELAEALMPIEITISSNEPYPTRPEQFVLVVSIHRFGNPSSYEFKRVVYKARKGKEPRYQCYQVLTHKGQDILKLKEHSDERHDVVTYLTNNLISSDSLVLVQQAIDRIRDGTSGLSGNPLMGELYSSISARIPRAAMWTLVGNEQAKGLAQVPYLKEILQRHRLLSASAIKGFAWTLELQTAQKGLLVGVVHLVDDKRADYLLKVLDSEHKWLAGRLREGGIKARLQFARRGCRVKVTAQLENVFEIFRRHFLAW